MTTRTAAVLAGRSILSLISPLPTSIERTPILMGSGWGREPRCEDRCWAPDPIGPNPIPGSRPHPPCVRSSGQRTRPFLRRLLMRALLTVRRTLLAVLLVVAAIAVAKADDMSGTMYQVFSE